MSFIRQIATRAFDRFPGIARVYRETRDALDRRQVARKTPWGFTLTGHNSMADGSFEALETSLVRDLLKDVDILVNVGANIGYYCCHALSLGKPVLAIEPLPRNVFYLLKNIRDNGWEKQAEVFPVAAGAESTIIDIWGGGTGASLVRGWASIPASYVTRVPTLTLDRLVGTALDLKRALIVVDVEGSELSVLQGAQRLLSDIPGHIWLMEITTREHQPKGVSFNPTFAATFDEFLKRNYTASHANDQSSQISSDDVRAICSTQQNLTNHNFVFRKN
jgi:FkbM family methyltransferase